MKNFWWLWFCLLLSPVQAADVLSADVTQERDSYRVLVDTHIAAPISVVRKVLADYTRILQTSQAVRESVVLSRDKPNLQRVRVVVHGCAGVFCRTMVNTQDVQQLDNGDIVAVTVPDSSDFSAGVARWHVWPEGNGTRLRFYADITPNFWIPPVIGSWAIKTTLHNEALVTVAGLERLAQENQLAALESR